MDRWRLSGFEIVTSNKRHDSLPCSSFVYNAFHSSVYIFEITCDDD